MVDFGSKLRQLHLLQRINTNDFIIQYPIAGDNIVTKRKFEAGRVWINDSQFFDKVPIVAWNFYIGGYQPAQKWLKDRKGRTLGFDDIVHYQKIIVALKTTYEIMNQIDGI
jgi:hypothetical protein